MKTERKEIDWTLSASSGMIGRDIDYDFFDDLSKEELLNFGVNLKKINDMFENEMKSRGI